MMAYASSVLRILFLGNEMRENTSQERTRLNLMLRENMPQFIICGDQFPFIGTRTVDIVSPENLFNVVIFVCLLIWICRFHFCGFAVVKAETSAEYVLNAAFEC